jgi:hypothetical protein
MPLLGVDLMKAANALPISSDFAQAQSHLLQYELDTNFTETYAFLRQ